MFFRPVSCPHCGAPVAEEQIGRSIITCGFCRGTFAPAGRAVYRAAFARAAKLAAERATPTLVLRGRAHEGVMELARSDRAVVFLARTVGPAPERVVVKLFRDAMHAERDASVLRRLAGSSAAGHEHFATRVANVAAHGVAEYGDLRAPAVSVRFRPGHLANGDDVARAYQDGIDGRAAVWIWRRLCEVLGFAHRSGLAHGRIDRSHAVVSSREHGVLLVGWSEARPATEEAIAADLAATATLVRGLASSLPAELEAIASNSSTTDAWATGDAIGRAARAVYGPPAFHPLSLPPFRR